MATARATPAPVLVRDSAAHTALDRSLSPATRPRIAAATAGETRRAYRRQWAAFTAWCASTGRVSVPATAVTLAEYTAALADAGHSPASIEQAIAAIRAAHRDAGHPDTPPTREAQLVLRAHRSDHTQTGRQLRRAPPITIPALRRC